MSAILDKIRSQNPTTKDCATLKKQIETIQPIATAFSNLYNRSGNALLLSQLTGVEQILSEKQNALELACGSGTALTGSAPASQNTTKGSSNSNSANPTAANSDNPIAAGSNKMLLYGGIAVIVLLGGYLILKK